MNNLDCREKWTYSGRVAWIGLIILVHNRVSSSLAVSQRLGHGDESWRKILVIVEVVISV